MAAKLLLTEETSDAIIGVVTAWSKNGHWGEKSKGLMSLVFMTYHKISPNNYDGDKTWVINQIPWHC